MDKANIDFRKPLKRFLRPFGEVSTKIPFLPKEHILVNV